MLRFHEHGLHVQGKAPCAPGMVTLMFPGTAEREGSHPDVDLKQA